jgi:hypothetical protein|nr:hypothetical protein [Kofleriaceae bacterium]
MSRTLLGLVILGSSASPALAQVPPDPQRPAVEVMETTGSVSVRGVADDYLVLPDGGELGTDLKLVTADSFAGMPLKFSDLGLFTLHGRVALHHRLELEAHTTVVPKQPSYSDEKVWQSAGAALRIALGHRTSLALAGDGGHLLDHTGLWTESALVVEHRKRITRLTSFDLRGGADLITVGDAGTTAHVGELQGAAAAQFRDPDGYVGGWLGLSYALPIVHGGIDPTDDMTVDPQPRLDLHIGVSLSPVQAWDIYIEAAIVDRGDLSNPATRLPILDGGFDQKQVTLGVVRHFEPKHRVDEGS